MLCLSTILLATIVLGQSDPPDCAEFPDEFFVNNPDNCRAYWFCQDALTPPRESMCPEGFHFDQGEQICNLPENYPCEDPITTEDPTITEDPVTETTEAIDTDEPETVGPPETTPSPSPPPLNRCEGRPNGHFLNDPTGCRSYFVCVNEVAFTGQCDMGFNFNETMQLCDHPSRTPCTNENFECPFFGISRWEVPGSCQG